jgi:hypothetical protein
MYAAGFEYQQQTLYKLVIQMLMNLLPKNLHYTFKYYHELLFVMNFPYMHLHNMFYLVFFHYSWLQSIDSRPGINMAMLDTLKSKLQEAPEKYKKYIY